MVYLEYPAYVEVDDRSWPFSEYKWFKILLISRTRLFRIPRLCRSIFKVPCPISPGLSRSAVNFPVCLPYLAYSSHAFTPAAVETNYNCRPVVHARRFQVDSSCDNYFNSLGTQGTFLSPPPLTAELADSSNILSPKNKCWRSNLDNSNPWISRSFFEVPRTSR